MAPCTPWITGEDVAACCTAEASSGAIFDLAASQASDLLFELSGRQFAGECGPRTVRPGCDDCWGGWQILSRGYIVGPWNYGWPLLTSCWSCNLQCYPSMVKLAGYPVREISEVTIHGDVVDPSDYNLMNDRFLVRRDDHRWPVQQNLTKPASDNNTFSITYTYGADPPELGRLAAAQLGCQLYALCSGGDCVLPTGTTRVIQQNVVVEKLAFISWAFRGGQWQTGLGFVDAFLQAYNPAGLQRRPTVWAPGRLQYAQAWGT